MRKQLREMILDYLREHPDASEDEVRKAVQWQIEDGGYNSAWVFILMAVLEVLLPLIIDKFRRGEVQ